MGSSRSSSERAVSIYKFLSVKFQSILEEKKRSQAVTQSHILGN